MVRDSKGVLKPAALGLNDVFKSLPEFQHPDMPVWDLIQWGMFSSAISVEIMKNRGYFFFTFPFRTV